MSQPFSISKLHRGMSSAADFFMEEGFCRTCRNVRFDPKVGAIRINSASWIADIAQADMDSTRNFAIADLDDIQIVIDPAASGVDRVQVFDGDGAEGTIYVQADLAFTDGGGGTKVLMAGDDLVGADSTATGTVLRIKLTSGSWAAGDAAGTVVIFFTSPGTSFEAEQVNVVGGPSDIFTATGAQSSELDFAYLDSITYADVRLHSIHATTFILNRTKVVQYKAAPPATVKGDVSDFEVLLKKWNAEIGDIFKTLASTLHNPAGHYKCSALGVLNKTAPKWNMVPTPDQPDALFDATTMPHSLRVLTRSPLSFGWGQPGWEPRLSGGDVEGYDEESGTPIILNPPLLQGQKILALGDYSGGLVFGMENLSIIISRRPDLFNLWLHDVTEIKANDRIQHEITESNPGPIDFLAVAGDGLFIQCRNKQIEYGAPSAVLVAGGDQTPYNGRMRLVSNFSGSSTVAPAVSANYLIMLDAEKRLRSYVYLGADGDDAFVPLVDPINSGVYDDFITETPVAMRTVGDTVFCIMSSGRVWTYRVYGVDRARQLVGAWGRIILDEPVVHWWGYEGTHRILTKFETGHSLLSYRNDEVVPESGFTFENRLHRRETIEASSYDATLDQTTFTLKTDGDDDATRLVIRHNTGALFFQQEPHNRGAIVVDDVVVGETSGATGVVLAVTLASGSWTGTQDAVGHLTIRRTSTAKFIDAEVLLVTGLRKAVTTAAEIVLALKAEVKRPIGGSASGKTIKFQGNYIGSGTGTEHYIGRTLRANVVMPTIRNGPRKAGLLVVTVTTFHDRTSDYAVRLSERNRSDEVHNMTAKIIGDLQHGQSPIETGLMEILAGAEGDGLTITIESQTTGQFRFASLELEVEPLLVS